MVNNAFKALAHPVRRDIVARLSEGSATVAEATREISVSKPAISKHLRVLEEAGVVSRVIDGRKHRLSLEPAGLEEAAEWLDLQRARWSSLLDTVDEFLKEEPTT